MAQAILMDQSTDPRAEIEAAVGEWIKDFVVCGPLVLVVHYMRPKKTAQGLYIPDTSRAEEAIQGKCGLVMKMGSRAFAIDETHHWEPYEIPKTGDWVMFRIADGIPFELPAKNGENYRARLVEDVNIRMIIPRPDVIW